MEITKIVLEVVLTPILAALVAIAIKFINAKANALIAKTKSDTLKKYIGMLDSTIETCIVATNQTYVDALKEEGRFDAEAQRKALEKTKTKVLEILDGEAVTYLTEFYGDLNVIVEQKIEQYINQE